MLIPTHSERVEASRRTAERRASAGAAQMIRVSGKVITVAQAAAKLHLDRYELMRRYRDKSRERTWNGLAEERRKGRPVRKATTRSPR